MSRPATQQPPIEDDALNPKVDSSAVDFLLIELIPAIQRITEQALAREQKLVDEYKRSKIFNAGNISEAQDGSKDNSTANGTPSEPHPVTSIGFPVVGDKTRDGMNARLDGMGYRVGQGLAER